MKEMRRILALVLCFVMLVGILPVSAFATDTVPAETSVVETTEAPTSAVEDDDVADDDAQSTPADSSTVPADTSTAPADTSTAPADTTTAPADNTLTKATPDANAGIALASNEEDGIAVAANDPVVVIAASDYQRSDSGTIMTNIMNQIKKDYSSPYGALMGGDYDAGSVNTKASHIVAVNDTISGVFPNIASDNRIYLQGNHENYAGLKVDGTNLMDDSGEHDTNYYGVYAINHDDFPWTTSTNPAPSEALVKATADALGDYLEEKASANYKKPIFVMSHLPLHVTRGDNRYAKLIFDELEAAGEKGLNIIFLVGHNHSGGYDQYLGNGSVYLPKGSSLTVVNGTNSSYTDSSISFTYMNYGYLGNITGSACTHQTMTAFEITDTQVTIKRYDVGGQHLLKAAGVESSGDPDPDENEYGYAVLSLSDGKSTTYGLSSDDSNAGSGDDSTGSDDNNTGSNGTTGGSGYTYELVTSIEAGEKYVIVGNDDAVALMDNNGSFGSQTVTISGTTLTSDVALTEWTISDTSGGTIVSDQGNGLSYSDSSFNLTGAADNTFNITAVDNNFTILTVRTNSYYSKYYFNYDGSGWTSKPTSAAYVRLYKLTGTGSGSGGTVTPEGGDWVTITEPDGGTTTYTYTQATSITAGEKYVIVGYEDDVALIDDNGEFGSVTDVNISGSTMTSTTELTEWTFSGSSQGSVGHGSNYLYSSGNGYTFRIDGEDTLYFTDKGNYFVIDGASSSRYTYAFYYDGTEWATSSNREEYVRLFQLTGSTPGDDATPGLFARIEGELTYNVERGLTAEQVLALVQAEIKGYEYSGTAAPGADVTGTEITEKLEFVLDSDYNGAKAGEYAVAIKYNDVTLGTAKVVVPEVAVTGCTFDKSGSVKVGASGKVRTGANITVNLADNTSYAVPITMDMLSGNFTTEEAGTYAGLTVTYEVQGNTYTINDFTLIVREPVSYPEYPDEGAVQVKKTAKGVQFQSTGVAQVEVSASGIPMNQGVDVLLVLDTSSSMGFDPAMLNGRTRIDVLRECVNALIKNLKAERADGSVPDVDISVVHFNGYYDNKTVNYINDAAKNTSTLGGVLADWQNVQNLADTWASNIPDNCSGTNYDHGLQLAYEQLSEKQEQDGGTRKQFVLFMSDGAPFQYNGVSGNTITTNSEWSKWILGSYTQDEVEELTGSDIELANPEFYYGDGSGTGQKHRIAEAIKGSTAEYFKVASYSDTSSSATGSLIEVRGLGATMYSVGLALEASNMPVDVAGQEAILKTIASSEDVFYSVTSAAGLQEAFDDFAGEALMAATNARFVDQMGDQYNLKMGQIKDLKGNVVEGVENKIEIISYDIWTRSDYLAGKCTAEKIGDRKGTFTVLETITFNADGTEVYSDKIDNGQTNILGDGTQEGFEKGVIYAKNFMYNANTDKAVPVNGVSIPTGVDENGLTTGETNMLPAETFYWYLGTIKTTELAMRYYVYLDGSMEGTCEAGSYPTNEYANLYYNNYLNQPVGQPCQKTTVSPVMAWDAANVSYAFYLVDDNGNIIVNQTTGETGPFSRKVPVTNPVVYREVLLNNTGNVESIEVASLGVLPDGYELYDPSAVYTIEINSDATGSWNIVKGTDKATTYVTHYDFDNIDAYTNELTKNSDADFTHTIVWFAVKWKVQALPDTVVIDYGLPVDISVLTNDMFGENGKLAGVGAYSDTLHLEGHDTALANGFGNEYKASTNSSDMLSYGDVEVRANGKVRYTPKTMQMNGYDKFAYAAQYTGATNPGYYYDTVTVIPATTVYFEDNFVSYSSFTWGTKDDGTNGWVDRTTSLWSNAGEANDATQAEDRPGKFSLTDANNIYGYDAANQNMTTYSQGSAMVATVDYDNKAHASFTFWGTGFDVISMTSNMTGNILVDVVKADGTVYDNFSVDTYYGYKQDADGNWVVDPDANTSLYQIPVMKVVDMPYGQYQVTIKASYDPAFDHVAPSYEGEYDFYLDAIRIYDPAGDGNQVVSFKTDGEGNVTSTTIADIYAQDGEGWPSYFELRNKLIDADTLGNAATATEIAGEVFIDGDATVGDAQIADYKSYGPNNEVYLAPNQSVAFLLANVTDNVANIHLGISNVTGEKSTYTIKNIARAADSEKNIEAGQVYNEKTATVSTSTDMYYDLTPWAKNIIVITNSGSEGIISLTNIKSTYKTNPENGVAVVSEDPVEETSNLVYAYMTPAAATLSLRSLNAPAVEEEEVPETTVPETTVPEETEPETEETKPSKPSKPGKGEKPEKETKPGKEDKPNKNDKPAKNDRAEEVRNNLNKAAAKIKDLVTALLGKWFR